jgi:hypothetical protein
MFWIACEKKYEGQVGFDAREGFILWEAEGAINTFCRVFQQACCVEPMKVEE